MDTYCSPAARARCHDDTDLTKPMHTFNTTFLIKLVIAVCVLPISLNGTSRDLWWPQAWFVILTQYITFIIAGRYVWVHNRGLFRERETFIRHPDAAGFDRVLAPSVVGLTPFLYLAAGLQHRFFQPGDSLHSLQITAGTLFIISLVLQSWALCTNYWFSSVVRIQTDRSHRVCSSGPYAYVRHPAYAAAILQGLCEAVLLTSSWCFVIAAVRSAVLIIRTVLEDSYLHQQLTGYTEYAHKVLYKLIPGVW